MSIKHAYASFWLECSVKAHVLEKPSGFEYRIHIKEAVVTGGHVDEGLPCLEDRTGQDITILAAEDWGVAQDMTLRYTYYNGVETNGDGETMVIDNENWIEWK